MSGEKPLLPTSRVRATRAFRVLHLVEVQENILEDTYFGEICRFSTDYLNTMDKEEDK